MTLNDINKFLDKENVVINSNDINIIYIYIKNNIDDILKDIENSLNKVKNKITSDSYNKILKLYDKYKDMILLIKK